VEELHGDPTVGPRPKVWTREVKNGRSTAEDDAPERLGCGTVKEEVCQILQRGNKDFLAVLFHIFNSGFFSEQNQGRKKCEIICGMGPNL